MMSKNLTVALIVFSFVWFVIVWRYIRRGRIAIKYGIVWIFAALAILFAGILPNFMSAVTHFFGFLTMSNLIIGFLITLLMIITLVLTIIVTTQKKQIKLLIQEVSLLKSKENKHCK